MTSKKRTWWPAMPSGGQHWRPEVPQQDPRTAAYWKCVQQDLSQAMPWALPERMQAQRTSPTHNGPSSSPQPAHTGHEDEVAPSRRSLHECAEQTGEHEFLLHGNGHSRTSRTPDQAAQPEAASVPYHMQNESAPQQQVLYAALFLSSEQQRLLLERQATMTCACACWLCSQWQMMAAAVAKVKVMMSTYACRVPSCFCNVRSDHMTLIFKPTPEQQANLPIGKDFAITVSGVVNDSTVQVRC